MPLDPRSPSLRLIHGNAALERGPERPRFDGPGQPQRRLDAVLRAIAHGDRALATPPGFVPPEIAVRLRAGRAPR